MKEALHTEIDKDLKRRVKMYCASTGKTMTEFVESAIRNELKARGGKQ